jgi:hypothetical protein
MIQDPPLEVHPGRKLAAVVQILVDRVAPGEQRASDADFIADLQPAHSGFGNRCRKFDHSGDGVME